jgi:nucleoside-diphosphate-sugar epimerase
VYGDGSQVRDFSHVANVSEAFLLVARKSFEAEVYNVAGEETVTIGRLTELICEILDVRPRFTYTGHVRPGDAQCWIADTTLLRSLGYRPKISLKEGLKDTIDWFLSESPQPRAVAETAVCGS